MDNRHENNIKPSDYFSTAMLVFLALGLDVVVVIVINLLIKTETDYKHILCNFCTIILWIIAVVMINKFIKKNQLTGLISNYKNKEILIRFFGLFFFLVIVNLLLKGSVIPQFIMEYQKLKITYGNIGSVTYIVQFIYYLLESALVVYIIAFGQKWGEQIFKNKLISYGGFMLALTWGLVHFLTQDLLTGIVTIVVSLILGIAFNLLKKNYILTWILGLIVFLV